MSDAHINGPVSDIKDQMDHNDPGLVILNNPIPPPMPTIFPTGMVGDILATRRIEATVESVLERVRINGISPKFQGGAIEFEVPQPRPEDSPPVISRITNTPRLDAGPQTPRLDAGPQTPRLDTGPPTPRLDELPQTPRLDAGPPTPRLDESPQTPRLDEMPQTPRIVGKQEDTIQPEVPLVAPAIANGDDTFFSSALCPVELTRADGQRKILAYIPQDTAYVVEGAEPGEKTRDLPPPDQYYTTGSAEKNQFQLAKGESGAKIHRGWLEWNVNKIEFEKKTLPCGGTSPDVINSLSSQSEIDGVKVMPITPANGTVENPWIELGWYGNVYAVVELDRDTGHPTSLTIEGPTLPSLTPIPLLDNELSRASGSPGTRYGYSVLIGVCNADGPIDQRHVGPLQWHLAFVPEVDTPAPPPPECGWWGDVIIQGVSPLGTPPMLTMHFENGMLKGVTGGDYTTGTGTEADPALNQINLAWPPP